MAKQFELILSKGTLISTNGIAGSTTGYPYFRGEKGLALKGDSTNLISFAQTLTGVKTILFAVKKTEDTKLIYDDVVEKIEVSGGNITGTGLTQCYVDGVDTDVIGNSDYHLVIAEYSAGINFSTNVTIAPSRLSYLAYKVVLYDSLLSTNERAAELNSFNHAYSKITEKYPRYLPEYKPTDLSSEVDIVVVNLMDAGKGTFDSGTETWAVSSSNTIENDNGALKITYVDHPSGANTILRESYNLTTNLIVGNYYKIKAKCKVSAGSVNLYVSGPNVILSAVTETSFKWYEGTFQATSTVGNKFAMSGMSAGEIIWIDEWYIEEYFGLVASFNFINTGGLYVDTSGEGHSITINKGISTLAGAKLSAAETIGNLGNIKTIACRIKPDSTTEKLMEGAANDKLIHINAGTLTYPEFDLAYVNGVPTNTIVADQWQNVVITSSTDVGFSACSLALNDTVVGNFEIADLQFYTDEKSANWVAQYHNQFASRSVLGKFPDDYDGIDNVPNGIKKVSGTFTTQELTSQDTVLKELDIGTKYISCDGSGVISISNKHAQGVYEFYINKANASDFLFNFIMSKLDGQGNGYAVKVDSSEAISGNEVLTGGLTSKFATANSYISHSTWYKIMVTVNNSGEVVTFVKGGVLGNKYVLADPSVSGDNPYSDSTYTTSNYIVASCGTGDKLIIK